MVLPAAGGKAAASARAVSTIVSVPCVTTMRGSGARRHSSTISVAIGRAHVQAVDHHQGPDRHVHAAAPQAQHLRQVRGLEEQLAGALVVFLVEGPAGDEDPDGQLEVLVAASRTVER